MKVHIVKNRDKNIICELKKRRNSKNIRMRIDNSGIIKVSLPYYTPYIYAKKFVSENLDWIEKKLENINSGKDSYYYLGQKITVTKKILEGINSTKYVFSNNELIFEVPNNSFSKNELYFNWLREKANEYIPSRAAELANEYNFEFNQIKIKNLTSRWGSCSFKKNLSFNLKLMYFNSNIIDYVIIHELCHLKEMNHSKKFWKLVENILPNYKEYRLQLNNKIHS